MKLRLDLLFCAILIGTAGSELIAPGALSAENTDPACQIEDNGGDGATRLEAEERILAEGYSEVSILSRDCAKVWHALAFAEGDPVSLQVTPQGVVLTE